MKVKRLIELLKDCDPQAEVILQRDSEGNGFSPAENGIDQGEWDRDEHEFLSEAEVADRIAFSDRKRKYEPNAVVLWPVW